MAVKMKGSAFKLGNVATKSALKQWTKAKGGKKHPKAKSDVSKPLPPKGKQPEENLLEKGPLPQKTKFTDKLKAFGTAITSKQGLMTPGNAAIKKAYSKYKREKKKYRDADRKSKMDK